MKRIFIVGGNGFAREVYIYILTVCLKMDQTFVLEAF
jgi:hypothetical protein